MSGTLRVVSRDMGRDGRLTWWWSGLQEIYGVLSTLFEKKGGMWDAGEVV